MSGSLPGAKAWAPNLPNTPVEIRFDGFETLNTKPTRPAIEENQMFICDGFMPFGKNNLRSLPGIGASLYTAPTGLSIIMHWFGNINTTPYCFVFLSDGSVVAVNTSTSGVSAVAPAGTIQNPSPTTVGVTQWGSQYIILVASQSNGYFVWDGSLLYQAGSIGPSPYLTNGGYGYTSPPTITAIGGEGSGASFTSTLEAGSVQSITVTGVGGGYQASDALYLAFSGGGGNTSAIAQAVVSGGSVTAINVVNGGSGYVSPTLTVLGGGGYGAAASATVSGGVVTSISVTSAGESYTNPPTVIFVDALNTVAQATAAVMPFGVQGNSVETFTQHVWVANQAKGFFSATGNVSDFGTPNGGGAFQSSDSFLKIGYTALKQTNGFLYLIADSSMNYISPPQTTVSNGAATTTFSNQNVDPQIGSAWPGSVQVFSRNIVFANSFGIHAAYGGAVTKVSTALDGIYSSVPNIGTFNPSAAVAVIYGIHVYMLLLPIIDQVTGQQTNKLLMWDGKRFWTSSQEITPIWIATQEINSQMTAWGTDGHSVYPLFQNPSSSLTKTVQSRLYDVYGYQFVKMTNRVFAVLNYNGTSFAPVTITVDNGVTSTSTTVTSAALTLSWTNNSGGPIAWTNSTGGTITWTRSGLALPVFAASQTGAYLGLTLATTAPDVTVVSIAAILQNYQSLL